MERLPGKIFETVGPMMYGGRIRPLFQFPAMDQEPDTYLVTLHPETHGAIQFNGNRGKFQEFGQLRSANIISDMRPCS